LGALG